MSREQVDKLSSGITYMVSSCLPAARLELWLKVRLEDKLQVEESAVSYGVCQVFLSCEDSS